MTKKQTGKKPAKPAPLVVDAARTRKKNPPRTAFKKGEPNPHQFVAGNGSPNPGGKPKCDRDRLIGKALHVYLQDRVPDDVCRSHGLPTHSSYGQLLAKRLIRYALQGEQWAYSEIIALTEVKRAGLSVLGNIDSENEDRSLITIEFVSANGDGRPCAEFMEAHPDFAANGNPARALPAPED
jgi:hypothetical protein